MAKKACMQNLLPHENQDLHKIIDLLNKGHNVFITGFAGTGKSYNLQRLKEYYGKRLVLTSTTGISAVNINGQTIHSWAGIGIANMPIELIVKRIKEKNTLYKQILCAKMLAIDEISMLDNKTLDYKNETLKLVRNDYRPFGGIQVLLFGDFFQLPPVQLGVNNRDFCFKSRTWNELKLKPIVLKETKRQTEIEFINALNNIRVGYITPSDTELFINRENESKQINQKGILHIFGTNQEADEYNNECFSELGTSVCTYKADDTLYLYDRYEKCTEVSLDEEKKANLNDFDKKTLKNFNEYCKAPEELKLKLNCKVMLVKNIDIDAGLVNGSCGTVTELLDNAIMVQFDNGRTVKIEKTDFIYQKDAHPKFKRLQFPLRLAYGITIHKSQGMTFDNLVVNFNRVFSDGQGYVALSRTRSLNGLILNDYAPGKISANPEVVEFYEQLEKGNIATYKQSILTKENEKTTKTEKSIEVVAPTTDVAPENIKSEKEVLKQAINNQKEIIIVYPTKDSNGDYELLERKIIPIAIYSGVELNQKEPFDDKKWDDNSYYLKAFCLLRKEERTFRLDRIDEIVTS